MLTFDNLDAEKFKSFTCQPVSALMCNLPGKTYTPELLGEILNFTAKEHRTVILVDLGEEFKIKCQTSGNPPPDIYIKSLCKNETYSWSSMDLKIYSCLDGGDGYMCRFSQFYFNKYLELHLEIIVKCPLQIFVTEKTNASFTTSVGAWFEVSIPVYGYPEPSHFTLLRHTGHKTHTVGTGYTVKYHRGHCSNGTIALSFSNVTVGYFSNYTLVFGNGNETDLEYRFSLNDGGVSAASNVKEEQRDATLILLIIVTIYSFN